MLRTLLACGFVVLFGSFVFHAPELPAAEHRIANAADLDRLARRALDDLPLQPGDVVILEDGEWRDQSLVFQGRGTAVSPITFRAETPGGVLLTGASSAVISGDFLVVSGLHFKEGQGGDCVVLEGRHCRLTDCAITGGRLQALCSLLRLRQSA